MTAPLIKSFFDQATNTFSYVLQDPNSAACAIIDSVLALDYASGRTSTAPADAIIAYIQSQQLQVEWILETHVHADHISAASYLQKTLGGRTGIGEKITQVQDIFGTVFNAEQDFHRDGSQFDRLFTDDDTFALGALTGRVTSPNAWVRGWH